MSVFAAIDADKHANQLAIELVRSTSRRMIVESFDEKTARAWLFGTNTRLDDEAPSDVLRRAG